MEFGLSEEDALVQRTARGLAAQLREMARDAEAAGAVPDALRARYDELELGDTSALMRALLVEELAFGCAGIALSLERDVIAGFVAPGNVGAVYVDNHERLERDGDRVRGSLPYLPSTAPARLFVLKSNEWLAIEGGLSATDHKPCALGAAGSCGVVVEGTLVRHEGSTDRAIAKMRAWLAAALAGVARASFEHALAYSLEREAFGRKIAHHQGMAFILAELRVRLDAARMAAHHAAVALDTDVDADLTAAQSLVEAADAALWITSYGIQILGGHGYVKDHPVEKHYREARTLSLLFGGRDQAQIDAERLGMQAWGVLAS